MFGTRLFWFGEGGEGVALGLATAKAPWY
jgi:hypothetical protein